MKLRTKLLLLVAGASLLFLASIAMYFVILAPLEKLQSEVGLLREMERSTAGLQVEADLLVMKPFQAQTLAFQTALDRYHAARTALGGVVLLLKANESLASAFQAVANLGQLTDDSLASVADSFAQAKAQAKEVGLAEDWASWPQVMAAAYAKSKKPEAVVYYLMSLVTNLTQFNDGLTVTRQVIERKDGEINLELAKIRDRSSLVGLGVILLAVILAMILSFFLARSITKALHQLGMTVEKVGSGDLRVRFGGRRKDELGHLGQEIDNFLDSLTSSFRKIQIASAENLSVKNQLALSVSSTTSSAIEIEANSASILDQLKKSDEKIQASESDLNGVVILLEAFHSRLGGQSQEVSDASKAVLELAQGISQISELSTQNRQAVEALLAESDRGREVFNRSFAKVAEINDSASAIQDLAGAIAEIAGQTNILALNAAIEAAHAGEAGKGFAVVADEISKLAAASATSSAQIAITINEVVGKIREAGATREETLGAFDSIGAQISRVSTGGRGIHEEAGRMNQGTHRIREVMETLSSGAQASTSEADRIGNVATKVGDALGQVGRISHEVVSNIGEITAGLSEISRTVNEVAAQADRLGRVGEDLDHAVNAFQTEEPEAPSQADH
jgi:methyl-accepting chemotaxis protein